MAVDPATTIPAFDTTKPTSSDLVSEGENNFQHIKTVLKTTFPNLGGAWNATQTEANYLVGVTSSIQTQLNAKGAIAGQTWTGSHSFTGATVTVATQAQGNSTTNAASTAFVQTEWTTRLPNYSVPITASSAELNYSVGVTSGIQGQINAKGAISGQAWTGAHSFTGGSITVPTQSAGDSSTNAASTAFVAAAAFSAALPGQAGAQYKFITTNGSAASWDWPYPKVIAVTGTSQTAVAGPCYSLQNAAATTLTLPASPANGDIVAVKADNLRTDNIIARNGNLICGVAENMTIDKPHFPILLQFLTSYGWRLIA
jgi:hypothetical protein